MKKTLSFEDESGPVSASISINKGFSRKYEKTKRREEIRLLEDRYAKELKNPANAVYLEGGGETSSDDSTCSDSEAITESACRKFLNTIKSIKTKDSSIYVSDTSHHTKTPQDDISEVEQKHPSKTKHGKHRGVKRQNSDLCSRKSLLSSIEKHVNEEEKFVLNYIANMDWIPKDGEGHRKTDISVRDSEDEEHMDKAEEFESAYNMRFEHTQNSLIKYPKDIKGLIRHVESRSERKKKRKKELEKQKEDLERLKSLKRKEIRDKIRLIKEISGCHKDIDPKILEEDFDPIKYSKYMKKIFDKEYYNDTSDDKHTIKSLLANEEVEAEVNSIHIDETVVRDILGDHTNKKKTLDEIEKLIDEYRILHPEDSTDELPVKFRYKEVRPSTHGLEIDDIVNTDDKMLDRYVPFKNLNPYIPEEEQEKYIKVSSSKIAKKKKIKGCL